MTTHTAVLAGRASPRATSSARQLAPVLIQVPTVLAISPRPARSVAPRGRRRLRREVRVAAMTLLFAMPMSWALFSFFKIGPSAEAQTITVSAPSAAPALVASAPVDDPTSAIVELKTSSSVRSPAPSASTTDGEPPVVLPAGYLVPDDGPEESAHAGY